MTVKLSLLAGAGWQFLDDSGNPLSGGLLYTYVAGTTTPAVTYTSITGITSNSNPIVLDSAGRVPYEIWLTESAVYKFTLKTSTNVEIWTKDNIPGVNDFASELAAVYANFANTNDVAKGDALVGFKQSNSSGILTNAVGRTVHQKLQETITVLDFGAVGDGVTDDTTAIQNAINALTPGNTLYIPTGTYLIKSTLNLPTFSTTGDAWDEDNPIRIIGDGPNLTIIDFKGTNAYAIAHPSINTLTNRGQNAGVELAQFTLIGPQTFDSISSGIGIDNTRRPYIHDLWIRGFPSGVGIELYGQSKGGTFGAVIERCRFGQQKFNTSGIYTLYTLEDLAFYSMTYAIWLNGPFDATGKVNDTLIDNNQMYDMLIGMVKISGHGAWNPVTSEGSSANTQSRNNVYFAEAPRKLETGTLFAVTSDTTMQLRQANIIYNTDGALNGLYLGVEDSNGIWYRRYIQSFTGSNRQVILESALPFTPTTSSNYRVGYANAQARLDFPDPIVLQHGFYWNSEYSAVSVNDYFEECAPSIVAGTNANMNFQMYGAVDVVNDGVYPMRENGSGYWAPRALFGDRPRGSNQTPAQLITSSILLTNSEFIRDSSAILRAMFNNTGGSLTNGDVIRQSTSGGVEYAVSPVNYTSGNGYFPHYVVFNPERTAENSVANQTYFTVARAGSIVRVKSDSSATIGDCLMSQATGFATPIAQSALTAEYAMRVLGVAIENSATTAVTGTAQAGTTNTITLASGASAVDDFYKDLYVKTTGGTGSGQVRKITAYAGATKVATVDSNWTTTPDNTTTYTVGGGLLRILVK